MKISKFSVLEGGKICGNSIVIPQSAETMAIACEGYLVKMKERSVDIWKYRAHTGFYVCV